MKQSRRQFLVTTAAAGAGITLPGIEMKPSDNVDNEGFKIKAYATRWGYKGSIDSFCKKVKAEGYDGLEDWMPVDAVAESEFFEAIDKYNLDYGALVGSGGAGFEEHLLSYSKNLERAIAKKPDFINCHAGRDFLSFNESLQLINIGIKQSKESGISIYQETHRGRMLFAAHVCKPFIDAIPELRLTLDISHWCTVAETLLTNQSEAVAAALQRTDHVHARIGHEEGAQVSTPNAPEWKSAREAHFSWWDQVVELKKSEGKTLSFTTEFGPPNYMWTIPYTYQPVADQWAINVEMMNEWRKRYL